MKKLLLTALIVLSFVFIPKVYAVENVTGAWTMYFQTSNGNTLPSNYSSTVTNSFGTSNYYFMGGSTVNTQPYRFNVVTRVDVQPTFNFVQGNYYVIKLNFDMGSYVIPYFPTNNSNWFVDLCTSSVCNVTPDVTYTYTIDTSHTNTNSLQVIVKFTATATASNPVIVFGNLTDLKGNFYNQYSGQQGVRLTSATIDVTEQSIDLSPIIENNNQNTQNIINNNNQNTQNIINNNNQNYNDFTDDDVGDPISSGGGGGTYFDTIGVGSEAPISNIILMPLNLINAIITNLESVCKPYDMPFDFFGGNQTITFPCWTLSDYLGNDITTIIDYMICIFMIYEICMLGVHFFESFTSLEDTFDSMYSPKHVNTDGGYVAKHGKG